MKGVRALASGTLVLAAACAVPAISAAQDAGTTTDATTTTTPTEPSDPTAQSTPADGAQDAPPAEASASSPPQTSSVPSENGDASAGVPAGPSGAAPAVSSPKAHKAASTSVTMGDFFFSPSSVSIAVGDTVTWRNTGQAPHNATADDGSFRTPDLDQGQSASHTFNSAGTFSYICTIHPNMKATVRVLSASGGGGGGGGASGADTSATGDTEAAAVASPDAAGDANTLPMTGMAAGALALVGLALLASGLLMQGALRRWFTPF